VEPVEAMPRLLIFGAGHVGRATAKIAALAGFRVTVIDDREELASDARFPDARLVSTTPRDARTELAPTEHDFLLVATHDHRLDEEALDTYARLPHRYLGVIGSRRKVLRILQRIAARGALPPLSRVYAPVGLDLGAVSPEEIAVSVVAELVAIRHDKAGLAHLRCLDDPAIAKQLADVDASAGDD